MISPSCLKNSTPYPFKVPLLIKIGTCRRLDLLSATGIFASNGNRSVCDGRETADHRWNFLGGRPFVFCWLCLKNSSRTDGPTIYRHAGIWSEEEMFAFKTSRSHLICDGRDVRKAVQNYVRQNQEGFFHHHLIEELSTSIVTQFYDRWLPFHWLTSMTKSSGYLHRRFNLILPVKFIC